jgi:polysaccharide biosynthesis protein PslH
VAKVFWITVDFPLPLTKGGRIRTFGLLEAIAKSHDLSLISLVHPDSIPAATSPVPLRLSALETFTRPTVGTITGRFIDLVKSLLRLEPFSVFRSRSVKMREACENLLEQLGPDDVVICDFVHAAVNMPDALIQRSVVFQHNVEGDLFYRRFRSATGITGRLVNLLQAILMTRFERRTCELAKGVICVSPEDSAITLRNYRSKAVTYIESSIDLERFKIERAGTQPAPKLLYMGSMDWPPNEQAVIWFVDNVMPLLRKRIQSQFIVVGRMPSARILALANQHSDVLITGTVPDVLPYMSEAAISVVPLLTGGGTRLKILEAFAARVPVVSTRLGAEGISAQEGHHFIEANSPEEFADAIVKILENPSLAMSLVAEAFELCQAKFSASTVAVDFMTKALKIGAADEELSHRASAHSLNAQRFTS